MFSKKIIVVGKSGSGKDYFMNQLEKNGLKRCVKWTTRPIRINETQGITYNFTTNENFIDNEDNFVVNQTIPIKTDDIDDIWYYGITTEGFVESDFMMMTPFEISLLSKSIDINDSAFIIYLDIDKKVRRKRVENRKDYNDSVQRRFIKDDIDFENFDNYHLKVTDQWFNVDEILDKIKKEI